MEIRIFRNIKVDWSHATFIDSQKGHSSDNSRKLTYVFYLSMGTHEMNYDTLTTMTPAGGQLRASVKV